ADHAQPCRDRLTQQRALAGDHRLLMQGKPDIGGISAQRFPEKASGCDANHSERMPFDDETRAKYGGVGAIFGLPGVMAEHRDWRSGSGVVTRSEHPAAECSHPERREIVPRDVFGAQRPGRGFDALTADAQARPSSLKRSHLFKLGRFGFQALVERKREHAPPVLRSTLMAAIVTISDPI